MLVRGLGRQFGAVGFSRHAHSLNLARVYSSKKDVGSDISQIPIEQLGVMAAFYVPPKLSSVPIKSWPKMIWRRLGVFALNTYSVTKYKRETSLKLKFNQWKETGIEHFVRINKVFAAACSKEPQQRAKYIQAQLGQAAGVDVIKSLTARAQSFPYASSLKWELLNIETNPKVVSFTALPDANNLTVYVQFVLQLKSKQKVTVTQNGQSSVKEQVVEDYLVYTMDPHIDDLRLVGKLFESDHIRKVQPSSEVTAASMIALSKKCSDLYRSKN